MEFCQQISCIFKYLCCSKDKFLLLESSVYTVIGEGVKYLNFIKQYSLSHKSKKNLSYLFLHFCFLILQHVDAIAK